MIDQIRPAQLAQWLQDQAEHGAPVVLDVREPHELQIACVKADGFTLLKIPMGVIPPRLHELNPDQPIACLCHHGARSMRVAAFLAQNGFEQLANVTGGIDAWAQEADATVPRY